MPELKDIIIISLLVLGFLGFLFSFGEELNITGSRNIILTPDPTLIDGTVSLREDPILKNITSTFKNDSKFMFLSDGSTGVQLD